MDTKKKIDLLKSTDTLPILAQKDGIFITVVDDFPSYKGIGLQMNSLQINSELIL